MALGAILVGAAAAHAQASTGTVRVAPSGSDSGGCGSVEAPCQTLQHAVERFSPDATGTIFVAAGTYGSARPREVVRITGRRLTIIGGYTTSFAASDPATNLVRIDGEDARRGFTVEPEAGTSGTSLALSGVTITGGRAPQELGTNTLSSFGGGLDAYDATIALTDVRFVANVATGLDASSGNPGDGAGGGCSLRAVTATLTRVSFDSNLALGGSGSGTANRGGLGVGGGLFTYQSNVTLDGVAGSDNAARGGDAPAALGVAFGQRADGLGGFWAAILSGATATRVSADRNIAEGGDAATFAGLGLGGGIFVERAPTPVTFGAMTLRANIARGADGFGGGSEGGLGGGGGLFVVDSTVAVDASVITSNLAAGGVGVSRGGDGGGGGLYVDSVMAIPSNLVAANVIIGRNAVIAGNGPTKGFAFGGGVFQQCPELSCLSASATSSEAEFTHVTFADNSVSGATYNQGAALFVGSWATATSRFSIVSGHQTPAIGLDIGEAILARGTTTFTTTLWDANTAKVFVAPEGTFSDVDPRSGAPAFVAPDAEPPDFRIQESSAARDVAAAGATPKDVDGEDRPDPISGFADLGADEFFVPEASSSASCAAAALALGVTRELRSRRRAIGAVSATSCL
jgi:hypothetical protein